ncbi:MAG TPA: NAD-dependent deacylase [Candidatus Hydrogenedentes bacterium]|nr:NAD-dependent deacylase [Candidatus Hydrogenedentota bacterium]HPG66332.1 NAD-dependent deacylase [Candidatus Hydrogenedentota bacterium]
MNDPYESAAFALRNARFGIAVTGAGMSVDSGIPSFRGADGLWVKYPVEEYATIEAFLADPAKVWGFWYELGERLKGCKPNAGHRALADLGAAGFCQAVITQNIDNLHEEAGSTPVIEYHGNARRVVCMDCGYVGALDLTKRGPSVPRCTLCNGLLKPNVVLFGEMIPTEALVEADRLARRCDVMLVVGTSAQVFPAAELPYIAKRGGAVIIEANTEPTAFTRSITDAFLEGSASETLPKLVSCANV